MEGCPQVDDRNPFGGAFLLLMLFALTYTFVCKYSAHRSEEVTSKAPNLYLQVCGGAAPECVRNLTFLVIHFGGMLTNILPRAERRALVYHKLANIGLVLCL